MKIGNPKDQEAGIRPINVEVREIAGTTQSVRYTAILTDIYRKMKVSAAFYKNVIIDKEGIHASFTNGMTADELGLLLEAFNDNRGNGNCIMLTLHSESSGLLIRIW